jgi:NADH-quinone oxidoreductase subunit G
VLGAIADQMDVHLGLPDAAAARAELAALGTWRGTSPEPPQVTSADSESGGHGTYHARESGVLDVRLATWRQLLDGGRMQDGEPHLAGTARPVVARMSAATAAEAGIAADDKVTVATDQGSVTVPADVVPMADRVVWLPAAGLTATGSAATGVAYPGDQEPAAQGGSTIRAVLGAGHGGMVTLRRPD